MTYVRLACVTSDLWNEEVDTERSVGVLQVRLYRFNLGNGTSLTRMSLDWKVHAYLLP